MYLIFYRKHQVLKAASVIFLQSSSTSIIHLLVFLLRIDRRGSHSHLPLPLFLEHFNEYHLLQFVCLVLDRWCWHLPRYLHSQIISFSDYFLILRISPNQKFPPLSSFPRRERHESRRNNEPGTPSCCQRARYFWCYHHCPVAGCVPHNCPITSSWSLSPCLRLLCRTPPPLPISLTTALSLSSFTFFKGLDALYPHPPALIRSANHQLRMFSSLC